ncbi:MAG: hypothetical protein LBK57_08270 [Clostridiales Family XIII bacterium]|jgi:hypothetical protein|nr:hypothetical protein [Clostridiales Family XIII bacterium]
MEIRISRRTAVICAVVLTCAVAVAAAVAVRAADGAPGSESDPVVTKSYVDKQLSEAGGVFVPLEVSAGKRLIGGAGTEIILRSGEASAIGSESNGISDLTEGLDLQTGAAVSRDHLLLVPRDDGRGLSATTDVWLMIRGPYTIN